MLLIKNGRVVDPYAKRDEVCDVLIDGDKILATGSACENHVKAGGIETIDASGLVVSPGLVDAHVHFRDPGQTWKEDIFTGAAAAAKGGVTTVILMANTIPTVDNVETLQYCLQKGKQTPIRVLQDAAITKGLKGQELVDMEALAAEGAAGFTDDGIPIMDGKLLREALRIARRLDLPVSLHEEDPNFIKAPGVNMGKVSEILGYGGASAEAEDVMVARDCILALYEQAPVVIQHISSAVSVELVRTAKKLGAKIYAEATPHHFTLTEDAVLKYGTNARMNPPLRTENDRQAIIEGLRDGTIDMIVTDHAPHSGAEKAQPMGKAPSGITGLETSLGLGIKSLVEPGHLTLMQLLEKMSTNAMKVYRRTPGTIAAGADADLVLFDPKGEWTVAEFASKASNSPFLGWKLPGRIHKTICGGKVIYQDAGTFAENR